MGQPHAKPKEPPLPPHVRVSGASATCERCGKQLRLPKETEDRSRDLRRFGRFHAGCD